MDKSEFLRRANQYAEHEGMTLDGVLGFGMDGHVWETPRSAIKVLERQRNYANERDCYLRLQQHGVTKIEGFTVPELVGFDDDLMVVEMGVVEPPCVLDFGKAHLDIRPSYLDEMLPQIVEDCMELFDEKWPKVQSILSALESYGIFYTDPRPTNIIFPDDEGE